MFEIHRSIFALALGLTAVSIGAQTVQRDQDVFTFLSHRFHKVAHPGGYEENFKRAVHFHDSQRFGNSDKDGTHIQLKAFGDDRSNSISPEDTQVALRYLHDVLFSSNTGPELAKIAKKMTSGQESLGQLSDFETCAADVNRMMTALSNNTAWAVQSE